MRYLFKNKNGEHVVEIIQESDKFYTLRVIREDGAYEECRAKKDAPLIPIPEVEGEAPVFDYWVTTPYQHQIDFLKYAETHRNFLLRDKPGLGKTKQALDLIMNRKRCGQIKRALIVCCIGGLQYNWQREVKKHTDLRGYILGTRPVRKNSLTTCIGSTKDKLYDLKTVTADILICNIEALRNKELVSQLQLMIGRGDIGQIVVDEVHKCKNGKAAQTAGLFSLHPDYKMGLTGTPFINSPLDIYALSVWMGHERRPMSRFKADYCIMGGFKNKDVVGYQNLGHLAKQLDTWSLMRTKEQCLDLPSKIFKTSVVDMVPTQKSLYREVLKDIRDRVEDIMALPTPMGRFVGLRKATGCPIEVLDTFVPEECAKFQELLRIIQLATDNNQKVVVYTWHVFTLQYLNTLLCRNGIQPAVIFGQMSLEARNMNEQAFQLNPDCKVILGNYQTMGTGIELTAAEYVVEYEQPWTAADEDQAIDRSHRIGQTKTLTCIKLISLNSVDERVDDIIELKRNLAMELETSDNGVVDVEIDSEKLAEIVRKTLNTPI